MSILSNQKRLLIGIITISVLLRVIAALFLGDNVTNLPGTYDQISYNALAIRVLNGHGFSFEELWWPITAAGAPTAHWSFLYTLYLVVVYAIFGPHPLAARILQAVITGVLHPYLAYLIGKRIFNPAVGIISCLVTALYAYFIYYDACLMTEPFYISAILGTILLALEIVSNRSQGDLQKVDRRWIVAMGLGVCMGVAVLLRQLFLLIIPFIILWIGWVGRKKLKSIIPSIMIMGYLVVCMILPFTIYNYTRFGQFVLLNTNSGYAFFWGNHPIYGTQFVPILTPEMGTYQDLIPQELRNLNEAALDQQLFKRGLQFVLEDPKRYLLLSISRIPAYFMFWPSAGSGLVSNLSRVFSFGILWPFMLIGLIRAWIKLKANHNFYPVLLVTLLIVVYSSVHILTWALIRYRLPVDAMLIIFASAAFRDLFSTLRRKFPALSYQPSSQS